MKLRKMYIQVGDIFICNLNEKIVDGNEMTQVALVTNVYESIKVTLYEYTYRLNKQMSNVHMVIGYIDEGELILINSHAYKIFTRATEEQKQELFNTQIISEENADHEISPLGLDCYASFQCV